LTGRILQVINLHTIRLHLEGEITIGLYAISPSTQRSKWVAIDADYKNALEALLKLQYHLWQDGVEPALELSKRGGHLWILLETPLMANECRFYIHDLVRRLELPVKGSGLADGIEVFPRHNAIVKKIEQRHSRPAWGLPRRQQTILVLRGGAEYTLEAGSPDGRT